MRAELCPAFHVNFVSAKLPRTKEKIEKGGKTVKEAGRNVAELNAAKRVFDERRNNRVPL